MHSLPQHIPSFLSSATWIFAKTYAKTWPHEYMLKRNEDPELFTEFVRIIRVHGYEDFFYSRKITYFEHDGMVYWTMVPPVGDPKWFPPEQEDLVNRCPIENTYTYRKKHGTLPGQKQDNSETIIKDSQMQHSLLSVLADRFVSQKENLATEALIFIMNKSEVARTSVNNLIRAIDSRINPNLIFRTQQTNSEDNAIPDIVGYDPDNVGTCIIEAKFWAGLTDNQPITYISELPADKPALLIFLCPEKRTSTLWLELLERLKNADISFVELVSKESAFRHAKISELHSLALITWESLLSSISDDINLKGDVAVKSDIDQLIGLCNRMNSEAFLPVSSEEISPQIARRNIQFADLVDELIDFGKGKGLINTDGFKATSTKKHYTRYMKLGDYFGSIRICYDYWIDYANTPIWLDIRGLTWSENKDRNRTIEVLKTLCLHKPEKMFVIENKCFIPLYIKLGAEKPAVIEDLFSQIMEVYEMLRINSI
jgi:hypothetical protein